MQESLGQRLGRAAAHMIGFEAQKIQQAADNLAVRGSDFERCIERFGPRHVRQDQVLRHDRESTFEAAAVAYGGTRVERLICVDQSAAAGFDRVRGRRVDHLQLALINEIQQPDSRLPGVNVVPTTAE
jgi:hypothetical protein